jgi:hypothetical protein
LLDENPDADFAFAPSRVEHVDSGLERIHRPTAKQLQDLKADPASLFCGNCIGAPSATICRRGLGLDYDRRMKWLVDVDYYYRALMRNGRFGYAPEPLIGTPTNASHQVTEICRDDGQVELGEAMQLFAKFTPVQRDHPLVKQGWRRLFRRFRMRKLHDFERYGLPRPVETVYFRKLLFQSLWRWELLLDPKLLALKVFYRLYPRMPAFIRGPLKRIAASVSGGGERP